MGQWELVADVAFPCDCCGVNTDSMRRVEGDGSFWWFCLRCNPAKPSNQHFHPDMTLAGYCVMREALLEAEQFLTDGTCSLSGQRALREWSHGVLIYAGPIDYDHYGDKARAQDEETEQ